MSKQLDMLTGGVSIDLQKFCYPKGDQFREIINHPFEQDGWTYATNGKILIRLPGGLGYPEQEKPKNVFDCCVKKPKESCLSTDESTATVRLEDVDIPDEILVDCVACGGKGHIEMCPDCEGDGVTTCCECGHEDDCSSCDGKGYRYSQDGSPHAIECEECCGEGKVNQNEPVKIYNRYFTWSLVKTAKEELPADTVVHLDDDTTAAAYLTFDGGDGVIMPTYVNPGRFGES